MASKAITETAAWYTVALTPCFAMAAWWHGWNPWFWGIVALLGQMVVFSILITIADDRRSRRDRCPRCGKPAPEEEV
jgi:hypothetical protein